MITLLIALRLIPYLLTAIIAWQKGFLRLTFAAMLCIATVLYTLTLPSPPALFPFVLSSLFSLALLFHALDLKSRKGGGR
ncbi:hypothetical protein [Naasia lichenicola]|uniref:Uncharacterized protein n=1 Tax=Naasia lichenicola TaxID=2565933 RepID=A0A4S4FK13_9MICO|nr:hypothetical protein [Naasia lichenicola]THG30669.1 hypothetical protein E6C64_08495 [Naasia lichenicola]THG31906.1 hypothetical protein E6C64_07640 [Naasia lichenicola]